VLETEHPWKKELVISSELVSRSSLALQNMVAFTMFADAKDFKFFMEANLYPLHTITYAF
jgi:hypothetical protein